jgi:predicted ATPase
MVLTCAHVVGRDRQLGDSSCRVTLGGELEAELKAILPKEDLAILKIETAEHPCISLDVDIVPDEELLAAGYPVYDKKPERDSLRLKYDGKTEAENGDFLIKCRGNLVVPGFSGGPLLNMRTAGVVGIVAATRGRGAAIGGWAIPSRLIIDRLGQFLSRVGIATAWQEALRKRQELKSTPGVLEEIHQRFDSLPSFASSFAGREREIGDCIEALRKHRWMTLTGMGGIGKTRLAVEVGGRLSAAFENGVVYVGLTHTNNSEQAVLSTLAAALKESGLDVKGDNEIALIAALKNRRLLLILDNFEAVMNGAVVPAKILLQCARVRLVVTSQRALAMSLEGEHEWPVRPMAIPQSHELLPLEQLSEIESFKLFRERAIAVQPDWHVTPENLSLAKEILDLTEGIPLSIELAAAQVGDRSLAEIASGIKAARLEFLQREGPLLDERHTSIRACIDWSFNLLPTDAQVLFPKLAVFQGGFFAEDVEQICQIPNGAKLLITLKNQSLLARDEQLAPIRYRMLGTVQDYTNSKLGKDRILYEARHAKYFLDVLKSANRRLSSWDHLVGKARINVDLENIFAGVNYSRRCGEHRALVEYSFSLADYLRVTGRFAERLALAREAQSAAEALNDLQLVAECENNLGIAYWDLPTGDRVENLKRAIACHEAALRVRTERDFPQDWATTQNNLGNVYSNLPTGNREKNLSRAIACYEAALRVRTERDLPQDWATTQNNLGTVYSEMSIGDRDENLKRSIECYEAALRVYTERNSPQDWAMTQNNLGTTYCNLPTGDHDDNLKRALACYEAALHIYTERDFPQDWAMTQYNLGIAYSDLPAGDRSENLKRAIACYEAALRIYTERDSPQDWAQTQNNLGISYSDLPIGDRSENLKRAIACYEAALHIYTEHDSPQDWAQTQNNLGTAFGNLLAGDRGENLKRAIACQEAALRGYEAAGDTSETRRISELLAGLRGMNVAE